MSALWKDAAGGQNTRAEDFARVDATPKRQGVAWVGAEIPHGGEPPLGEHLLHVFGQSICRRTRRAPPCRLREVHMAIPEPSRETLAGAVDHAGTLRDVHIA